jgi:hypothetical protein
MSKNEKNVASNYVVVNITQSNREKSTKFPSTSKSKPKSRAGKTKEKIDLSFVNSHQYSRQDDSEYLNKSMDSGMARIFKNQTMYHPHGALHSPGPFAGTGSQHFNCNNLRMNTNVHAFNPQLSPVHFNNFQNFASRQDLINKSE